jgi:hypothetical protein
VASALDDEERDTEGDRDEGGPDIGGNPQESVARRVDANRFEPAAAESVPDEIDSEGPAPAQVQLALYQQDDPDTDQVPDDLVEEQRVEQGAGGEPGRELGIGGLDLKSPRERGRQPEEFVVEVIAEAAEATSIAGARASANDQKRMPWRRQPM